MISLSLSPVLSIFVIFFRCCCLIPRHTNIALNYSSNYNRSYILFDTSPSTHACTHTHERTNAHPSTMSKIVLFNCKTMIGYVVLCIATRFWLLFWLWLWLALDCIEPDACACVCACLPLCMCHRQSAEYGNTENGFCVCAVILHIK